MGKIGNFQDMGGSQQDIYLDNYFFYWFYWFFVCNISVLHDPILILEETPINKFPQDNNYVHYVYWEGQLHNLNICVKRNQFNKVNFANVILLLNCNVLIH